MAEKSDKRVSMLMYADVLLRNFSLSLHLSTGYVNLAWPSLWVNKMSYSWSHSVGYGNGGHYRRVGARGLW